MFNDFSVICIVVSLLFKTTINQNKIERAKQYNCVGTKAGRKNEDGESHFGTCCMAHVNVTEGSIAHGLLH